MTNKTVSFTPIGSGVEAAVDGDTLILRVPLDRKKGKPSSSGKMVLTGSTEGWGVVPGTDGFRLNVMGGYKI